MNLSVVRHASRDGGGYLVSFEGGEALLQPGLTPDTLDIIWFAIEEPRQRKTGRGARALALLSRRFADKKLKPWSVAPEAAGFWEKMAEKGYCVH